MRLLSLGSSQLHSRVLQEGVTGRLEVALEGPTAALQEESKRLPHDIAGTTMLNKRGNCGR
jgi:hypothetical protein